MTETTPATPQNSSTEKKPDWFINSMQGFIPKSLNEMHSQGIFANGFSIEDPEAYWSKKTVKAAFTGADGKERRDLFDEQYKDNLSRFKTHRDTELNIVNFSDVSPTITAERSGVRTPKPLTYKTDPDPMGRSYQSGYGYTDPFSKQEHSLHETAVATGVRMDNGTYVAAKDFTGTSKFATGEKGGLLFNEDGKPYLVPVKDGEQLHSWDNVYNKTAEKLGAYGYDYSWGNLAASLAKNPINFASQSIDDLVEYGRGFLNFWGLDTAEADKSLNRVENMAKSWQIPTTEGNQDSFFNVENIADLSQQVVYQLGTMAAVGATVTALTKNPKLGSIASKLFMTAISAGGIAEISRDNGLSKKESAILLGITSTALYPLMGLSEAAIGRLATKESMAALKDTIAAATQNGILIKQVAANPSKATLRTIYSRIKEGVKSTVYKGEKSAPLAVGVGSEAIEETAEQLVDLGVRSGYNAYSYSLDDAKHPFSVDFSNELAKLGQAAVGGAIGGGVAHTLFSRLLKNSPGVADQMHDMVMDGKEETLRSFISNMHAQGRLDHNWMNQDGKITTPTTGDSKNDQSKNVLNGLVDYLVELRDSTGMKDLYKTNKAAATSLFAEVVNSSSVGKDASDLNLKILSLSSELERAKTTASPNTELVSSLSKELEENKTALSSILAGGFVNDYVQEGLYNTLAITSQDQSFGKDRLTGKEFSALTNQLPETFSSSNTAHGEATKKQKDADEVATLDSPDGASAERVAQLLEEARADYSTQYLASSEQLQKLGAITDEGGFPILNPENLSPTAESAIRGQESNVLRNTAVNQAENPEESKTALEPLFKSSDRLSKIEGTKGSEPLVAPLPIDELLKMTEGKDASIKTSPTFIADKIADELALRDKSVANGVSLYSNTPQLKNIRSSIEKRIGQVKALNALHGQVTQTRAINEKEAIPEITPEMYEAASTNLEGMLGKVNSLIAESDQNSASADLRIRQATSALLGRTVDYLNKLSEMSIGTPFAGIQKLVDNDRERLHSALESSKIQDALTILNETETNIYSQFSGNKQEILRLLQAEEASDFSVRTYDYVRGILSLSSSDFWNACHSVLTNSNTGIFSPSDEHLIIAKQAVQGIMAGEYNPPQAGHPQAVQHHNSAFIEGRGGTAKTKTMVPLIAGIVSQLTPGKVFLTAASDHNDFKRTNLVSAVENFFRISDKQLGISLANSTKNIIEFLDTPGATADVNLIVYDEGTLLSTKDLRNIQNRLNKLNQQRAEGGTALLKILYTGDTLQNSIGTDKTNPDTRAIGIDDIHRHVMQRTPALTFSFRQTNQQLSLFSSYLESIQSDKGTSRAFSTEYGSREGVQIYQSYAEFMTNAASYLTSLKNQNRLHEAVYITDKGPFELDSRVRESGVAVMTSEQAQGREWPITIFDPNNAMLFTPDYTNLGVKKDYYTAATRASEYLLTHVAPGQNITSSEGSVNKVKPLSPENASRPATIEKVLNILGSHSAPVSQVAFDYKNNVSTTPFSEDFPMEDEKPSAQDVFEGPKNPLTGRKFQTATSLTAGNKIVEYLTASNRDGLVSLHTFFTDNLIDFDEQMNLKRKAIYDLTTRKTTPYFLSINRIGTPGYENVLRNNPEFNGSYAVFIEAEPSGKRVILGTLSSPGLDKAIKEGNILQGRASARLPLSQDFLADMENTGVTVFNKTGKVQSLGGVKTSSKGIRFGSPYIVTTPRAETNVKGQPRAKAGEIFVPASFFYSESEIGKVLAANNASAYITKVPVRTTYSSFSHLVSILDKYVQDGKFNFNAEDGLSGRVYDAFWSHNAESGTLSTGENRESRLSAAFAVIRDTIPANDQFRRFLDQYVEKTIDDSAESQSQYANVMASLEEAGAKKKTDNNNTKYFLKHYLEAKDKGQTQKLINFERAVRLLASHPYFKKGFEFNPRISYGSTSKNVTSHAQARNLPEDFYNKYLEAQLDYISPPVLRVPLNHIVDAVKDSSTVAPFKPSEDDTKKQEEVGVDEAKEITETSTSAVAATVDENPVSDNAEDPKVQEDEQYVHDISPSLAAFQERWFSQAGFSSIFPATIQRFRRGFMDTLFSLNAEDGAQPFLREINAVIKSLNARSKDMSKTYNDQFFTALDPVNDEADRDLYMRGVTAREFPFLLKKYFPAVWQDPKTKEWKYRSTHYKSRSFSDKESFNLLTDGMTDMVKTQLYNTPIIRRLPNGTWKTTGEYVWEGDIESLIDSVQGSATIEEAAAKLKDSPNQAAQSLYMRFAHNEPYKLDGADTWSIGKIQNNDVFQMRDAVLQFILSGQIFDLTKVDLEQGRLRTPWSAYGTPNTIREVSHKSVTQVAENQGKFIVPSEKGAMIIGPLTVSPSSVKTPAEKDVMDAIHAIGLTTFKESHLREIQQLDYAKFNIAPAGDIPQKVNNAIIDQIILPVMKEMSKDKFVRARFRKLNILYDAIVRTSGASNVMMNINVEGNKAYRLRWGGPIYRLNTQIEEIKDDDTSVLSGNLVVNGDYKVEKIPIKDGFEARKTSKDAKRFSAQETGDFDVIWSFVNMLKDSHASSGQYDLAMFTPMVWSDSPTDPQFIVRSKHGFFRDSSAILNDLYESRKHYYTRQSGKILSKWNEFFEAIGRPDRPSSLSELSTLLQYNRVPLAQVEKFPGMVNNLYYLKDGNSVGIKASLLSDVAFYSGDNLEAFKTRMGENLQKFSDFSKESKDFNGLSMTQRLDNMIEGKSGDAVLKAFYYNWLAFSSELSAMTAGPNHQYKGTDSTAEFIDNVKRNKLLMANRTSQLFRNQSWRNLWQQAKNANQPLSPEMMYEGKKLPRVGKIAYVKDIKKLLTLPSGLTKNQEVYDGATFVVPTTRIMQKHSNSGSHGMYVGAVMKNVTTILQNNKGVPTYIKNAEYLITPELMQKGTPLLINIVKRAYMQPFTPQVVDGVENGVAGLKTINTPLDYLLNLGVKDDFSNATWEHFEKLMDFLVENGLQDSLILEIAPDSSVKTGRGATNEFNPVDAKGNPLPYILEDFEQVNKGTQLDASHGVDEISNVRGSQILNAMAVNWPDPVPLLRMYRGLAEIAYTKINEWKGKSIGDTMDSLKGIISRSFAKRPDISYASRVSSPDNSNNFSIDDSQLYTSMVTNLNAELTDDAVLLDFEGGQYIVHPTNGLIHVYDVVRDGKNVAVLKNELQAGEKNLPGRDLKWNREDGYAEILLPASMRMRFGIKPGTALNEITPDYFKTVVLKDSGQEDKAGKMFESFQKTLRQIVTRIPATGKHSAMAATVVGFIDDSENAVFVPAEMLFVQGADQDADKGTNFSYETVGGIAPEVDGGFELMDKNLFGDKNRKKARTAGIKNAIVEAMETLLLSPTTLQERNTPVDTAKEELEKEAIKVEATYSFDRDDYTSYLRMREINQAGMTLRGIFSFAMKSYQIMTIAYRTKGVDPASVGLSSDPKVAERLGALVNAAVDNAKDQLLGKLGIGEHNANMVSYMVMKGMTFEQIHQQLVKYAPQMEQMKHFRRYDSTSPFRASLMWAEHPDLSSLYYLGNEVSRIAALGINRTLPSSDVDMIGYRKNAESFVNGQYKALNLPTDFRLTSFLENSEYAGQQIAKYGNLRGKKAGAVVRSEFNVLQILNDAPHIKAYMQVFLLSHNLVSNAKSYKVASRIADEVMKPTAQLDDKSSIVLSDLKKFTYGLFIDQYLENAENPFSTKYDLGTTTGRSSFVKAMSQDKNLNKLRIKYPLNSFVDALTVVPDVKYSWDNAPLLRIQDLQQTSEEKRMQIQSDFSKLDGNDRKVMVLYNLITRQGRFGKDSFGSIFSPADKADFNRFLDQTLDITKYDYEKLADKFNSYRKSSEGFDEGLLHNAIPYKAVETNTAVQLAGEQSKPVVKQETDTLTQETADFLSNFAPSPVSTKTPIPKLSQLISDILREFPLNAMETAYLDALRQEIENRAKPGEGEVDEQAKGCAPKR